MTEVKCASCGGSVQLETEGEFLTCPFCHSTLYIERNQSLKHFYLAPVVSEERAKGLFKESLEKSGLKAFNILSIKSVVLPFLTKSGERAKAAYTPHPAFFETFSLPSGEPLYFDEDIKKWGELAAPDEESFLFLTKTEAASFSLYHIPFYEITFGMVENKAKAYIDAVTGKTACDSLPVSLSVSETNKVLGYLFAYFFVFAAISFFFDSSLLAFIITLLISIPLSPLIADYVLRKFK